MARLSNISFILLLYFTAFSSQALETYESARFNLAQKTYQLEIADTHARKMQGLMFRRQLDADRGMLFVYDRSAAHYIWMKNTRIPLTVLWLDPIGGIVDKQLLQPCTSDPCASYGNGVPSQFIIELAASEFDRFRVGDSLPSVTQWYEKNQGTKSCFLGVFC